MIHPIPPDLRRRVLVAVALALTWATTGPALAEERPKWWFSDRVKAEIGLTDRQSADIESIFQNVLPSLRNEKSELDRLEDDVSRLLVEGGDESTISQAIDRLEARRGATNKTRTLMLFRMYKVLSPEQRTKLKALHERMEREREGDRRQRRDAPSR